MSLIVCWVLYPLILVLLAHGAGTLLQLAAGRRLSAGIRLPCGLALIIAVLDLFTRATSTAHLAVTAAVVVGVVGLVVNVVIRVRANRSPGSRARSWRPTVTPAAIAALVVFAVYGAPIVLSGGATWAGYIKLDDTATFLALVDQALVHGRTIAGLPPSTYQDALSHYLTTGYPLGSFLPLGLGHALLGQDVAWLTDPWMATMGAMLALALAEAVGRALPEQPRWQAAAIAALAAQPALLYAYYLWGGMKEMAGAFLIAAFAACAPLPFEGERRLRAVAPALVVVWALVAAQSPGGLVWIGPGAVIALVLLLGSARRLPRPSPAVVVAALLVAAVGLFLVLRPSGFVQQYEGVLTGSDQLGNLVAPLHLEQIAGIWPSGDFRFSPAQLTITHVLIGIALACAAFGLLMAVRERRSQLTVYVVCAITGAILVWAVASPWLGGKALATASPAIPVAGLFGAVLLARHWLPVGVGLAIVIAGGIVWSNVLGYHDVSLAPRAQFAELADIGHRIAGGGPTLMTEYQPYGARHFLRDAAPESASELRVRLDPLLSGQPLPKAGYADIDQFQLGAVLAYRTIVLQRSPVQSRPPSPYKLVYEGRWWQVWQRGPIEPTNIIAHLPLGTAAAPGAEPACATIVNLARNPAVTALIGAPVVNPTVVNVASSTHPAAWTTGLSYLSLSTSGTADIPVTVPSTGRYSIWLGGSIQSPTSISVNGRHVGAVFHAEQELGQYVEFGDIGLSAGAHVVELHHGGGLLLPGSGDQPDVVGPVGPLVLRRDLPNPPLERVPARAATTLCGRNLDWVEALGR